MQNETTKIAYMLAETIITGSILMNKGKVYKNIPYVQNVTEKELNLIFASLGKTNEIKDVDHFNNILSDVLEKRLNYYYAEGFTEEREDHYYFLTMKELENKNEEMYGQD